MFGAHNDDAAPAPAQDSVNLPQPVVDASTPGVPTVPDGNAPVSPSFDNSGFMTTASAHPAADEPAATGVPLADDASTPVADGDLLDIKQQALQQLSPLVSHLEQSPEDKFRTTMMMIQASDNQALIKDAYAAAQQITDEKTRAQALLDIVNEINYFTQAKPEQA
jgi:hypothetical protein